MKKTLIDRIEFAKCPPGLTGSTTGSSDRTTSTLRCAYLALYLFPVTVSYVPGLSYYSDQGICPGFESTTPRSSPHGAHLQQAD